MTPEERINHCYLGDGVYAENTPYHLILRTGDHTDERCDAKIYLDQDVFIHLLQWLLHLQRHHFDVPSIVKNVDLHEIFRKLAEKIEKISNEENDGYS